MAKPKAKTQLIATTTVELVYEEGELRLTFQVPTGYEAATARGLMAMGRRLNVAVKARDQADRLERQ